VAKPLRLGWYFTTISSFAPNPPVASTTAFAFNVYSFPSLSTALTPVTFPSLSFKISVALLLSLTSMLSFSTSFFKTSTIIGPTGAPPFGL